VKATIQGHGCGHAALDDIRRCTVVSALGQPWPAHAMLHRLLFHLDLHDTTLSASDRI
jgi:hypothetical protein